MDNPLVSCLCLTRNRREWLPKAVDCFLRQTYENRELLIVPDRMEDVIDFYPDERIHTLMPAPAVVGTKRNLGCAAARGEIIAVWDDDDYSAPDRLAYQVEQIQQTGKAVHGWYSMKFSDGPHWWLYRGNASFVLGTSLCFRRDWWLTHPFQEIQCGQDENFAMVAFGAKQLTSELDIGLMYATVHPGNTSPRRIRSTSWTQLPGFHWADPVRVVA
jgi:glycosyltransferase involved in cell wall biosynthesis